MLCNYVCLTKSMNYPRQRVIGVGELSDSVFFDKFLNINKSRIVKPDTNQIFNMRQFEILNIRTSLLIIILFIFSFYII